jgi:hypothetical protein
MKRVTDLTSGEDTMRNPHRHFGNRNASKMKRMIDSELRLSNKNHNTYRSNIRGANSVAK